MCRAQWLFVAVVVLLAVATPAAADPAGPTHFRSTVLELDGDPDAVAAVEVDVLAGDAFLTVRAAPGVEVEVPGYDGEPYLRFLPDGTVEVNVRSPARWLNDARYGAADVEVPAEADGDAPPVWETVATDGRYAWHDHRVHFMSPTLPPSVDRSSAEVQPVLDWEVPLLVDDREVVVIGRLDWVPGPTPLFGMGAVVLAVALGFGVGWRRPSLVVWAVALGVLATGGVMAAAGFEQIAGLDPDTRLVVLPGVAMLVLAIGIVWSRRDRRRAGWLVAAAAVPLGLWAVLQAGALSRPIVPGPVAVDLVRGVVTLAWAVVAVAVGAVLRERRGATGPSPT